VTLDLRSRESKPGPAHKPHMSDDGGTLEILPDREGEASRVAECPILVSRGFRVLLPTLCTRRTLQMSAFNFSTPSGGDGGDEVRVILRDKCVSFGDAVILVEYHTLHIFTNFLSSSFMYPPSFKNLISPLWYSFSTIRRDVLRLVRKVLITLMPAVAELILH